MSKLFNWAAARLVAAFALALPLAAMAATPVAVWDGGSADYNFTQLTRGDYTLAQIGQGYSTQAAADGSYLQIGTSNTEAAFTLKKSDGTNMGASTVIIKFENMPANGGSNRALLSFLKNGTFNNVSDIPYPFIGVAEEKNLSWASSFIWDNGIWDSASNVRTPNAFSAGQHTAALAYSYAAGSAFYVDGVLRGSSSGLRASGYSPLGVAIGGVADSRTSNKFYAMTGMKVTAIAFFADKISDADVASYVFPSDADKLWTATVSANTAWADIAWDGDKAWQADMSEAKVQLTIGSGATVTAPASLTVDNLIVSGAGTLTFATGENTVSASGSISAKVTLPANATLKTSGVLRFDSSSNAFAGNSLFEVVSGTAYLNAAACGLSGDITVDAGATLVNLRSSDALNYNANPVTTVRVYGTLDFGSTRWSTRGVARNCYYFYDGAVIKGVGDSNGALDFIEGSTGGAINLEGAVALSATIKTRDDSSNIALTVAEGKTATLNFTSSVIGTGKSFSKAGAGTLKFANNPTFDAGLKVNAGALDFTGVSEVTTKVIYSAAPTSGIDYLQASNWKGTFVADWVGANNAVFPINSYGNANSVVEVTKLAAGYVSGSNANITVVPTVKVSGFMTLDNGYSGKVTTLTKLTGSGVFTNKTYSVDVTTLDNFTGTLATLIGTQYIGMRIGTINLSSTPAAGAKIVNVTSDSNIGNIANTKVSVNGVVDDTIALEVKSDGIYVVVPTVTITVPTVANASVVVSDGTNTYTPATAGGTSYSVPAGSTITVTYTADEGYGLEGKSSYTLTNVAEGDAVTITDTEAKLYVAQFNNVKYTTVQGAINAWAAVDDEATAYSLVSLLGDVTESSVAIPVGAAGMPCQINGGGHTLTAPVTIAKGACLTPTALTIAGNLTVNGTYYRIGPEAIAVSGALTFGDGATIAVTALSSETSVFAAAGAVTISGDLNVLLYSETLTAGEYTIATGASVTRAADSQVVVTVNGTVTDTWALSNTKTAVVLTGAAARVNDDTYPTFTEAVTAANGTDTIELLAAASYTLTAGETVIVKAGSFTFTVSAPQGYVISETTVSDGIVSYTTSSALVRTTKEVYDSGAWRMVDGYPKEYASIVAAIADITIAPVENSTRYTVTMLGNETLATRAEPNYSMTIDLGGYTLTREGTSGNGSVFDVKSGTVTIKNGTIDCTQDDAAIVADGVYAITARSGSVVTLEGLTITVDSQAGACVYPFEGATVTIKSGTYKNETAEEYQYKTGWTGMAVNQANVATRLLIIEGGKFSQVNPEEGDDSGNVTNFLAAGRIAKLADGYWVVSAGTWVAEVGGTKFESLAEAVAAAESGATVTLLADVTLNSTLTLPAGKTLTMDLGGFTIYSGNDSSKRIVVNGTVTMTNGVVDGQTTVYDPNIGTAMIRVNGSLTLGANLTIRNTINAVAAFGTGSLTVNGATINALGFAISTNGSATGANASNGTVLAINSGTITSTDVAVYLPSGTMTINGGTITGSTGVYAKGGSLSVPSTSTAVITGNGANAGWSFNGNGANSTGDALVIDNSAYPYGPATATIAGGTYESTNGDAIGNYTKNAETLPTATGFVSGGTFNTAVADTYCAEGFEPKDDGEGHYTVRVDLGWIYEAEDHPNYTGAWSKDGVALDLVYDSETGKAAIEDGATYTPSKPSAGQLVTINLELSFDAANSDDDVPGGAKAAVRLGEGETEGTYVFQLYTTNELGTAAWLDATASGVTPAVETDYEFTFVLDMTNKTFTATVDGVALTVDGAETLGFASANASDTVQSIEFTGSGKVTSITGSYETPEPPPAGFAEDEEVTLDGGKATLTEAQAEWLNGCGDKAAVNVKIATMTADAFNNAYLLNLNILNKNYLDYEEGDFVVTDFRFDTKEDGEYVVVEVSLERNGAALDGGINGTLKLKGASQLGVGFEVKKTYNLKFDGCDTETIEYKKDDTTLFYKPVIE